MTGDRDAADRVAEYICARWQGVAAALEAADGPGWEEGLEDEPEVVIREAVPPAWRERWAARRSVRRLRRAVATVRASA